MRGKELLIEGIVQGVGFRPFVYRIAGEEGIAGDVANTPAGVRVRAFAEARQIERFHSRLESEAPPLARIDRITTTPIHDQRASGFTILHSAGGSVSTGPTPDAALCDDCRNELFDPSDRRFHYPFLNCTACGPRFSIIARLPYDRANTSMRDFAMCDECQSEYEDVSDRRFHAQPVACPLCGPSLWLEDRAGRRVSDGEQALAGAVEAVRQGKIVAVKGLGGFHLACDATSSAALVLLRERKGRPAKPFAVMVRDCDVARRYCRIGPDEERLLNSPAAPILLCDLLHEAVVPPELAPGLNRLGILLHYSPLHTLLLNEFRTPLVITSGNASGDPQVIDNDEARTILSRFADLLLLNDRPILNRVDDSVVQLRDGKPQLLRRARGYAPDSLPLPGGVDTEHPDLMALGGDLKNAFAAVKKGRAYLSQHIGDLDSARATADLERTLGLYCQMFDLEPGLIAADAHPDYRSTQLARTLAERAGVPLATVAHHHAHAASCMAEHGLPLDHPPVLALVHDGIGFGADGTLWGAELLLCDYRRARRLATLLPAALAGGDVAAREPWRNLAVRLQQAFGDVERWPHSFARRLADQPLRPVLAAAAAGLNAPSCSSAGRLFDAVAAALGLCVARQSYEGEAAMRLQASAEQWLSEQETVEPLPFDVQFPTEGPAQLDPSPIWAVVAEAIGRGNAAGKTAAAFHCGWANAWCDEVLKHSPQPATLILSGGVFQNRLLARLVRSRLFTKGVEVLEQHQVPAGDGGLALGQAVISLARQRAG